MTNHIFIKSPIDWEAFQSVCIVIWGKAAWRRELKLRADITDKTFYRWKKQNRIKGPVVAMLNAFARLRSHQMTLPEKENCAL